MMADATYVSSPTYLPARRRPAPRPAHWLVTSFTNLLLFWLTVLVPFSLSLWGLIALFG